MIIVVVGEKGGSGKSCLAQNIAVYLRTEKHSSVLLVDCDPQATCKTWNAERTLSNKAEKLKCIQMKGKLRDELVAINHHYDCVVVDCGGQDILAMRSAMAAADHIVMPLRPNHRDLKTIARMEDILSTCKMVNPTMNAAFVLTQCPTIKTSTTRIEVAKQACALFAVPALDAVIYQRTIYDDSEQHGSSVLEDEPKGKAASEIRGVIDELLARGASQNATTTSSAHYASA